MDAPRCRRDEKRFHMDGAVPHGHKSSLQGYLDVQLVRKNPAAALKSATRAIRVSWSLAQKSTISRKTNGK